MKAVIVEDEFAAAQSLQRLIGDIAPDIEVVTILQSIEDSVEWFGTNPAPDVVFLDIHLSDGSSFSIFDHVSISCPIIFTTAYDQYALQAFDVNSVDYLLKPVDSEHLERAIGRIRKMSGSRESAEENILLIEKIVAEMRQTASYKTTFLIPLRDKLIPLPVKTIAFIYTEDKIVRAVAFDGKETIMEQTLDDLYSQLDPRQFFRANRQYIVARNAVSDISLWFNGRLQLNLSVKTPERIFISRLNAKAFKMWLTE